MAMLAGRSIRLAPLVHVLVLVPACSPSTTEPRAPELRCPVPMDGPLAQYVPGRVPPPTGAPLPDGTFDLVDMLVDEVDTRTGAYLNGIRMRYTFVTDQRDAQHSEGRMVFVGGVAPQTGCTEGRFAVFGDELRMTAGMMTRGMGTVRIVVTPDGFVIDSPGGGTYDVKGWVFRRR